MTEAKVEEIFRRELKVEIPDRSTDIIDSGLIDSLSFVRLLAILEREFAYRFELDRLDLDDFRTVTSIAGLLDRRERNAAIAAD